MNIIDLLFKQFMQTDDVHYAPLKVHQIYDLERVHSQIDYYIPTLFDMYATGWELAKTTKDSER